jgi:hypothetical protein
MKEKEKEKASLASRESRTSKPPPLNSEHPSITPLCDSQENQPDYHP